MQSQETFVQKTFEMVNQLTGHKSFIPVKVQYLPTTRQINILRALNDINNNGNFNQLKTGFNLYNCHIFYFDNYKKLYVHIGTYPLKHDVHLKLQIFLETTIHIRYRKITSTSINTNQSNSTKNNNKTIRQKRTKQKTIKQVLQLVSKWRNLYQHLDYNGKKLYSLQQAAEKIGIQKKTLDDYYYKIKNSLTYGFDIQKNMNQKIGTLRQFVKQSIKNKTPKLISIKPNFNLQLYPFLSFLSLSSGASIQKPDELDIGKYIADYPLCSSDSQQSSSDKQKK